jgi:hypothetical protein
MWLETCVKEQTIEIINVGEVQIESLERHKPRLRCILESNEELEKNNY